MPRLLPRTGPRSLMVAGSALSIAGMVWLTQVSASSTYLGVILGPVLLFGAGAGLVSVAAMFAVPPAASGAASGALQATQ
ncbi:hypothetical protein [Spirillospora sp. CA-294931]|uniref:hypothetical protein n=1 Tax=Spirillospora sp. CA-294931 TaxID=3240042 RepID=UPI003D8AC02E